MLMCSNMLDENKYYTLHNKKFYEVDISDGIESLIVSHRQKNNLDIYKIKTNDTAKHFKNFDKKGYLVKQNNVSAHGETLKQAISDLTYKIIRDTEVSDIVQEIKETKKVTKAQYRAITGACQMGVDN